MTPSSVTKTPPSFVIRSTVDALRDDRRDRELLRRLAGGDAAALGDLYDRQAAGLFRHAFALTRLRSDAEDLVQATFVKLVARGPSLMGVRRPASYLHRMLHAEWIDLARRRAVAREEAIDGDLPGVSQGDAADAIDVRRALRALPELQREVVVLHVFNGFSFREIGRITRVSTFTTASRYRLAIDRLRLLLGER